MVGSPPERSYPYATPARPRVSDPNPTSLAHEILEFDMVPWSDEFWLGMAQKYADEGSKDPSTKVGSVIVRPDKTACSWGTNGFPNGIEDTPERLNTREIKYDLTIHAELNALLFAPERVVGYTQYSTFAPCVRCAVTMIQAKLDRVVFKTSDDPRWRQSQETAILLFKEAGIKFRGIGPNPIWWEPPCPVTPFAIPAGILSGEPLLDHAKLMHDPSHGCC
jgi:dCMP deaminase